MTWDPIKIAHSSILSALQILTLSTCHITSLTLEELLEQLSNNYVSKQSIINRPKASPELLFFYSDRYPQMLRSKIKKVIQDKISHLEGVIAQMEGEIAGYRRIDLNSGDLVWLCRSYSNQTSVAETNVSGWTAGRGR
jgi:predicted DNA-binding protein YlxM (UPF0122 family)